MTVKFEDYRRITCNTLRLFEGRTHWCYESVLCSHIKPCHPPRGILFLHSRWKIKGYSETSVILHWTSRFRIFFFAPRVCTLTESFRTPGKFLGLMCAAIAFFLCPLYYFRFATAFVRFQNIFQGNFGDKKCGQTDVEDRKLRNKFTFRA